MLSNNVILEFDEDEIEIIRDKMKKLKGTAKKAYKASALK